MGKTIENSSTTTPRKVWPWRISTSTVVSSEYSLVQNMNLVSLRIGRLMPSARNTAARDDGKAQQKAPATEPHGCTPPNVGGDDSARAAWPSLKAAARGKTRAGKGWAMGIRHWAVGSRAIGSGAVGQ